MNQLAQDAQSIWIAGVDAVRAKPLVKREVKIVGGELLVGERSWSRADFDRVVVVGAGKAATQMAAGLIETIGDWLPCQGWVNVPEGTEQPVAGVHVHPARPAGVNEPTHEGVHGTEQILKLVADAGPRDLCIALISGGGSALLPAPIEGITLEDKRDVTQFLSGAGADITELNTVRKHLSRVKGGGLLRACRAAELVTLILSDVLGDPLDLIASGPTVVDQSSVDDAISVLQRYDPEQTLPKRIYDTLDEQRQSEPNDTPPTTIHHTLVIGNNAVAVDEAGIRAVQLGYNHAMQSATSCEGSAESVGEHLAEMILKMLNDQSEHRTNCLITGGEPTVQLAPKEIRGRGGRNQHLVLAAYKYLLDRSLTDERWRRFAILSGGTDGEDGPTDAAGAVLSYEVHERASQLGLDIEDYLRRSDAYSFFEQTEGLIFTGPTGTNVCDVRVAVVS